MESLPDFLTLSKAQIAENARQQDDLRLKFNTRLRTTPLEDERAKAMILEPTIRESIILIEEADAEAEKHRRGRKPKVQKDSVRLALAKMRLAENLASQGKYLEASQTAPTTELTDHYKQISDAVFSDDEDLCECERPTGVVGNDVLEFPRHRILGYVYSVKHAREMPLLQCQVCGEMNVRSLTPNLVKAEQAKSSGKQLTDTEIFKR